MKISTTSPWLRRTARAFHPTRLACLAALTAAALPAFGTTVIDEFNGSFNGVPPGWTDMNLDPNGGVVIESNGTLTIQDPRSNNPHLLISNASIGSMLGYTLKVNIASAAAAVPASEPTSIAAVGGFNSYAIVVQFNARSGTFNSFINGPRQCTFAFNGTVANYVPLSAINFVIQAGATSFRITAPANGYDSGELLYSTALDRDGLATDFQTIAQLGSASGFLIGAESGGSADTGALSSVSYDRVELNTLPVAVPVPGNTISDDFTTAGINGLPAGWIDGGGDTDPASTMVQSGSIVTVTDTRSNGGPQFMQSTASIGAITAATARVSIASMTATSGSVPEAITIFGPVPGSFETPPNAYSFVVLFDSATNSFKAVVFGPDSGSTSIAMPGTYNRGALSYTIALSHTSFHISSGSFTSAEITYASMGTDFTLASLGSTVPFGLGTESAGNVSSGVSSIAYDRVDLDTTTAAPANTAPVANAGPDQSIHAGTIVNLNGAASFDDNTASAALGYAWSLVQKPAGSTAVLSGATTISPVFVADKTGDYTAQLIVTDAQGLTSLTDSVIISSNNIAPTAVATVDFNVAIVGSSVHFNGAGSADPEHDALSYAWAIIAAPAGSTAALTGATTATPSLVVDKEGTFRVTLTVSDFLGAGAPVTLEIVATLPVSNPVVQITYSSDVVEALPASKVSTKGNQTAFGNFLKNAIKDIQKGKTASAIASLQQAIERTDGIALRGSVDGNGANRDWITDPAAQTDVYNLLTAAVYALQH
jgi:hypothetical protein